MQHASISSDRAGLSDSMDCLVLICSAAARAAAAEVYETGDQLDVERSMLSKIRDRHATRNRRPRGMTVGDLRCHRRCGVQLVLEGSRSTPTDPVLS